MRWLIIDQNPEFAQALRQQLRPQDELLEATTQTAFTTAEIDGVIADQELLAQFRAQNPRLVLVYRGAETAPNYIRVSDELSAAEFMEELDLKLNATALFQAIAEDDAARVSSLLQGNPKLVEARELPAHWTPLHRAAATDSHQIAEILLQNGADPNAAGQFGEVPLHLTAGATTARVLIGHGAVAFRCDEDGNSPMDWALKERNHELIVVLAKAIPDLGSPTYQVLSAARKAKVTVEAEYLGKWGHYRVVTLGWTNREEVCEAIQVSGPSQQPLPVWRFLKVADLGSVYLGIDYDQFPDSELPAEPVRWVAAPDQR